MAEVLFRFRYLRYLSVDFNDNDCDYPYFRALVISVHGGDDVLNCPVRNKNDPTAWKHRLCREVGRDQVYTQAVMNFESG
jgi:hypothetical protein